MTVQRWISENYFASSVPRRVAAFVVKIGIEGSLAAVVGAASTAALHLLPAGTSVPLRGASPVALWVPVTAVVFTRAWCLLTRERAPGPTE